MNKDIEKKNAALKAVGFVEDGMVVGLGTGSTVKFMIEALAEKVKNGMNITAVATSKQSEELARSFGINVVDIGRVDEIDLTIDGADEFDKDLNGIKGGGGALLYEKIVASNSKKNIWITDSSKYVEKLGKFPLPVEVVPFGSDKVFNKLKERGYNPSFRMNGDSYFVTDGNHFIVDLHLNTIEDCYKLNSELLHIPGVVETGLFLNIADMVILGKRDGVRIFDK